MAIWARIKNMSPGEIFQLFKVSIWHPLFVIPTLIATRESVKISDKLFEEEHHENNRTNAFRHALWNYLICKKCYKVCNSVEKSTEWSKKITDLHEELAPNKKRAKMMDLHNNMIGRKIFEKIYSEDNPDFVMLLKKEMKRAVKIRTAEEISEHKDRMVYIEDRT